MMNSNLIIFIDGLQFDEAVNKLNILKNARCSRVVPGIGFSNNIYPEMFCGQNPDEIGFFNDWSPREKIQSSILRTVLRPFDILKNFVYLNAGFRIILLKKLFNISCANIPFKYYDFFKAQGAHNFRSLGEKSLLEKHNFEIIDTVEIPMRRSQRNYRDLKAIELLRNISVKDKNIFLSLTEIDNISHTHGMYSPQYESHIEYLDLQLSKLIERFKNENEKFSVYLLSDHGMAPVTEGINIDLESVFGKMSPTRYFFFIDSTLIRLWIKDKNLELEIKNYLNSLNSGEIISESERSKFGIVNKDFGNIIFQAKEGVMFVPNFFGGRIIKGMHGYASSLKSQTAIFSELHTTFTEKQLPLQSKDIFHFLSHALEQE